MFFATLFLYPSLCRAQTFATDGVDFGDGASNVFSAADVGPDGKFYVLWKDGNFNNSISLTTPRFKLIRWEADTSTWTTLGTILGNTATFPNIISDTTYTVFGDRMGLRVDSQGRFHIAIHVYYTYGAAIVYGTSANGSSWSFTNIETNNNITNYTLSDPQIDLDPDGKPHVVLRVSDSSNSDASQRPTRIRRHLFNGSSWSGETVYSRTGSVNAINGGVGYAIDSLGKGHLAIPVESNGSGTDASLYYLNNSSGSWSTPLNLAAGATSSAAVISLDLVVDPEDKIHVVRRDQTYNLHHHTNASGTWQGGQINGNLRGNIDYESLTVNSEGDLLLAYNTHTGTNLGNVAYACRFTGESSWQTGPVMSGNSRTGQYFSIAFKSDHTAMILFDHFTGTGSPSYGPPNNPRQLQYATAVITPPVTAPTLTVSAAESLTSSSVRISGEVVTEGISPVTARGFVHALASISDPEIGAAGVTQAVDSGSGVGTFSTVLSGLTPDTDYVFRVYAIDEDGTTYSPVATFSTNLQPVITSNGGTSSASVSVAENSSAVTTVSATDADAGHTLTYGISGGTDAGRFTINPSSGALTFVEPPDFEAPGDANSDNDYQVIISATDDGNTPKSVTQTLTVTVTNVVDNGELVIEQANGSAVASGGSVDFGSLTLGQTADLTFTLRSVGEADLVLPDGMALGGASSSAFSVIGSIPSSLAAGSSITFTVRFSPTAGGSNTADLSFATNDTRPGRSPHVLNLSGSGLTGSTPASYANAANQVRGGWINDTNFTIGEVTTNWNSSESPDKVVDNNTGSKFLLFRNNNAGLILSPTNSTVAFNRLSLSTANDAPARDPASYVIYGSPTVLTGTSGTDLPLGGLTLLASGTIVLPDNRSTGPTVVQFANTTAYASYIVAFPTVRSTTSNTLTQISEVQLSQGINPSYPVAMADARGGQLSSGTFTFGSIGNSNPGTNWNANESPDQALDGSVSNKYLLFRNTGAGLIVSPQAGPARVNRLSFWTANDSAERDPLTYQVYGFTTAVTVRSGTLNVANDGTLLGSGTLTLPPTRNAGPETVTLANNTAYASYLVVFPTVKNSPVTSMMQIAEVQFGHNGTPDFSLATATVTVAESSGSYSGDAFATDITPGIGDVGQTVSLATTNDNNPLFSVQPAISSDGTLTFTPAANASGTATVTVIATDSTGLSSAARSFTIEVTAPMVPGAPISLVATAGDGEVSVAFTAGPDGGSAITRYEFSTDDGNSWTAFDPAVSASPAVISGLTNGTAYSIRLRAVNAAGSGAASDAVSSTPVALPIVFRAASKAGATTSISVAKVTSRAGIVLGATVSVASVAAASEQGATVTLAGSAIQYTPPADFSGVDRFRVTFTSSAGSIVGLVEMTTAAPSHLANPARLTPLPGGRMGIQFNGIPGGAYQLQRSTNLASWTTIATVTAGSRGEIDFTDDNPPAPNGFYRLFKP